MRLPDFRRWRAGRRSLAVAFRGDGVQPFVMGADLWCRVFAAVGGGRRRSVASGRNVRAFALMLAGFLTRPPTWLGGEDLEAVRRLAEWLQSLPDGRKVLSIEAVNLSPVKRSAIPAGKQTVRLSSYFNTHPPITLPVALWERLGWGWGRVCRRQRALKFAGRLRYLLGARLDWMGPAEAEAVGRLAEWLERFKRVSRCRVYISFRK